MDDSEATAGDATPYRDDDAIDRDADPVLESMGDESLTKDGKRTFDLDEARAELKRRMGMPTGFANMPPMPTTAPPPPPVYGFSHGKWGSCG